MAISNPLFPNNPGYNLYKGARYVPKFTDRPDGQWNNTISYEPLTIVLYQGDSYTSRQFVPVGVDINNKTYWLKTGNFNGQIEAVNSQIQDLYSLTDKLCIPTVDSLKTLECSLGDIVFLNGYHTPGDIPETLYRITETGTPDGGSCFALDNGLYASAEFFATVTPENFGVVHNSPSDQNSNWETLMNYARAKNLDIVLGDTQYWIYQPLQIKASMRGGMETYFVAKGSQFKTITGSSPIGIERNYSCVLWYETDNSTHGKFNIGNFIILVNDLAEVGFYSPECKWVDFHDITSVGGTLACMLFADSYLCTFERLYGMCDNTTKYGMHFGDIKSGIDIGGTTISARDIFVNGRSKDGVSDRVGIKFKNVFYSTIDCMACDNLRGQSAYEFERCDMCITSCGSENGRTQNYIQINNSSLNFGDICFSYGNSNNQANTIFEFTGGRNNISVGSLRNPNKGEFLFHVADISTLFLILKMCMTGANYKLYDVNSQPNIPDVYAEIITGLGGYRFSDSVTYTKFWKQ